MPHSEALVEWLANGERGISSNTMVTHLLGINALKDWIPDHPWDPSDLGRCRKLMEQVPEIAERFPGMATCTTAWRHLVESWDELCRTMDKEAPNWREGYGVAPRTYSMMQQILERARDERKRKKEAGR